MHLIKDGFTGVDPGFRQEVGMAVLEKTSRARVADEMKEARRKTAELFAAIDHSHLYDRPIAERHRVVFYIGHLETFDFTQICRESLGQKPFEPELDALFQTGIDPEPGQLPSDTPGDWPKLEQVKRYVADARRAVDAALDDVPEATLAMAVEHRHMHLETLAYMWHNLDYSVKVAPAGHDLGRLDGAERRNEWCDVSGGRAWLGKPRDGSFGWDNEYDEHAVAIEPFRMERFKVTNGEYLEFVRAGGPKPNFWTERNGELKLRTMFAEVPLPLDWPVYVTQRQAAAYAKWKGKALPSEAQYQRAAFGGDSEESPRLYPWGAAEPNAKLGNFDFRRWDPEPVDASQAGESAFGLRQLAGNGWEWTRTLFGPFEGFQPAPTYPGYSANFFDGEHYVIKGGSPRTAARLLRRSFRNWFRGDYPYVYAAFRCVED